MSWSGVSCYPSPCTKGHLCILFITFPPPNSLFFWLELFVLNLYYMPYQNHSATLMSSVTLNPFFFKNFLSCFPNTTFCIQKCISKKRSLLLIVNAPFCYSLSEGVASVAQLIILRPLFILLNTIVLCFHMPEVIHHISLLFLYLNCLTEESLVFKSRMKWIHKQQFGLLTLEDKNNNKKIHSLFYFMFPSLMGGSIKLKLEKQYPFTSPSDWKSGWQYSFKVK